MHTIIPIGHIQSPYKEKFAVPRQPGLVDGITSYLLLTGEANCVESVRGLEEFSHIWLLFMFDQNLDAGWKPTVRPPRLGGNKQVGVFASRSPFRPNGMGISAVKLKRIIQQDKQIILEIVGADLIDNTPVFDIKPYIHYCDVIADAQSGYAEFTPEKIAVTFHAEALASIVNRTDYAQIKAVIEQVLSQDPRPAYKKETQDDKIYGVKLFDLNVKFTISDNIAVVTSIDAC